MIQRSLFRYLKTGPDIIRVTVTLDIRFLLSLWYV
jgi:hypothetical protein